MNLQEILYIRQCEWNAAIDAASEIAKDHMRFTYYSKHAALAVSSAIKELKKGKEDEGS